MHIFHSLIHSKQLLLVTLCDRTAGIGNSKVGHDAANTDADATDTDAVRTDRRECRNSYVDYTILNSLVLKLKDHELLHH